MIPVSVIQSVTSDAILSWMRVIGWLLMTFAMTSNWLRGGTTTSCMTNTIRQLCRLFSPSRSWYLRSPINSSPLPNFQVAFCSRNHARPRRSSSTCSVARPVNWIFLPLNWALTVASPRIGIFVPLTARSSVVYGRSGSPYTMLAGSSVTSLPVSSRHRYFFPPSSSSM